MPRGAEAAIGLPVLRVSRRAAAQFATAASNVGTKHKIGT
jgi:hypothetical protein